MLKALIDHLLRHLVKLSDLLQVQPSEVLQVVLQVQAQAQPLEMP
jgi:hypothetical protein